MNKLTKNQNPNILFHQAFKLHQSGQFDEAEQIYRNILKCLPDHTGAQALLGNILVQSNRNLESLNLLESSLKKDPKQFWTHNTLGVAYLNIQQYDKALTCFDRAINLNPEYADAYFNQAKTFRAQQRYQDAIDSYSKCITINPEYAEAYSNRGTIYLDDLSEIDKALADYQLFIKLRPNVWYGYYNIANALKEKNRYEEALTNYNCSLDFNSELPEIYNNRGTAYNSLRKYQEAIADYNYALKLKPNYPEVYNNLGNLFSDLKLNDKALSYFNRALELRPNYPELLNNRGVFYNDLKRYEDASVDFEHAYQSKPQIKYLLGHLIHANMHLCEWSKYLDYVELLVIKTDNQEKVCNPFPLMAIFADAGLLKKSAEVYVNDKYPKNNSLSKLQNYLTHQKIRIGYFSADFYNHATMHLISELFEQHDRNKFELYGFSFGINPEDEWTDRVKLNFDKFINVSEMSDKDVAIIARELEIDIAVDLKGFTQDHRAGIFSYGAAPIQINYLGYPGTMGASYMDYIIADRFLIPQEKQECYSEKVIYLPYCYQVNMKNRSISDRNFTREEMGLPSNSFVFCSFNNNYKITPEIFDVWMRILLSVENSVLWLFKTNDSAAKNLKNEAVLRGVDPNRLIFASFVPIAEHLKRIQLADLFLDTYPYNAHTTASDALRVGLPIVTMTGESFASRVAGSLLETVGLSELITTSLTDYEYLSIELATNAEKIQRIKNKLINNLSQTSLYDSKLFTSHLESAYEEVYERQQKRMINDHIYVIDQSIASNDLNKI